MRVTAGALLIAAELVTPYDEGIWTATWVLNDAGLGFLLLSTIGFLGLAYVLLPSSPKHLIDWLQRAAHLQ